MNAQAQPWHAFVMMRKILSTSFPTASTQFFRCACQKLMDLSSSYRGWRHHRRRPPPPMQPHKKMETRQAKSEEKRAKLTPAPGPLGSFAKLPRELRDEIWARSHANYANLAAASPEIALELRASLREHLPKAILHVDARTPGRDAAVTLSMDHAHTLGAPHRPRITLQAIDDAFAGESWPRFRAVETDLAIPQMMPRDGWATAVDLLLQCAGQLMLAIAALKPCSMQLTEQHSKQRLDIKACVACAGTVRSRFRIRGRELTFKEVLVAVVLGSLYDLLKDNWFETRVSFGELLPSDATAFLRAFAPSCAGEERRKWDAGGIVRPDLDWGLLKAVTMLLARDAWCGTLDAAGWEVSVVTTPFLITHEDYVPVIEEPSLLPNLHFKRDGRRAAMARSGGGL